MKVLLDHNLSPKMARALAELFRGQHEVYALRDKFSVSATDIDWIEALNDDNRWVVISGDRRITKNKTEYNAFRSSKLIGFFLSKGLYKSKVIKQTERILAQWESIEQTFKLMSGGSMFELQLKSGRLQQIK